MLTIMPAAVVTQQSVFSRAFSIDLTPTSRLNHTGLKRNHADFGTGSGLAPGVAD